MTPVIEVRDVTIGWSPAAVLIEHASFVVEAGEIFGILGRSASGKSTLLRALIGLDPPLAGDIRVLGAPVSVAAGRPRFGVMFQQGALFGSMTVGDNVGLALAMWTDLPRDAIRALVHAKLRQVGLESAIDTMPSELSGGMRKRAAIARTLALDPPLIFLDEPSSGLDPVTSAEIDRLIQMLASTLGLTIVVVTHELGSINAIIDRCIVLDHETRSIFANNTPAELARSSDHRLREFFGRQPGAARP
jgi:phospholipid/cholesterol/gamma-HCH transport system ATP-binding protein